MKHQDVICGSALDPSEWTCMTEQENRKITEHWRDVETLAAHEKIYRNKGIRWVPFLLLPYWTPKLYAVVDAMHALLLGMARTHCREISHMAGKKADEDEKQIKDKKPPKLSKIKPLDPQLLEKGQRLLEKPSMSKSNLQNLQHSTLRELCDLYLPRATHPDQEATKKIMTEELYTWVRYSSITTLC
ncbi:hypothetical protein K439DRAFT_1625508 [Ramaria rubella]|nr:hypothetical protein K439DRAFT_1625508 [Ramaria rubella]